MTAMAMDGSTDQKVGGSSPSERTAKPQVTALSVGVPGAFIVRLSRVCQHGMPKRRSGAEYERAERLAC